MNAEQLEDVELHIRGCATLHDINRDLAFLDPTLQRARQIIEALRPLQIATSGLRYASRSVPHQMSDSPSVAASSWLVLAAEALSGNPIAEQFWK